MTALLKAAYLAMLVWLASIPIAGKRVRTLNSDGRSVKRTAKIPREGWLVERCATHNVVVDWNATGRAKRPEREFYIAAVAKVEFRARYDGPLTAWNTEERLLWEINLKPLDAMTLRITAFATLSEPQGISEVLASPTSSTARQICQQRHQGIHGVCAYRGMQHDVVQPFGMHGCQSWTTQSGETVADLSNRWCVGIPEHAGHYCIFLEDPFMHLATLGAWHSLLLRKSSSPNLRCSLGHVDALVQLVFSLRSRHID